MNDPRIPVLFSIALSHGTPCETKELDWNHFRALFYFSHVAPNSFPALTSLFIRSVWLRCAEKHATAAILSSSDSADCETMGLEEFTKAIELIAVRALSPDGTQEGARCFERLWESHWEPYVLSSTVQLDTTISTSAAENKWSLLTNAVVVESVSAVLSGLFSSFLNFSTRRCMDFHQFQAFLQYYDLCNLVEPDLAEAIFVEANTEDTKGIETGVLSSILELDEFVDALLMVAIAAFADETRFSGLVTIQSKVFALFEHFAAAHNRIHGGNLALPAFDFSNFPYEDKYADPWVGIIHPETLSVEDGEEVFVGGVLFPDPSENTMEQEAPAQLGALLRTVALAEGGNLDVVPQNEKKSRLFVWFGDRPLRGYGIRKNRVKCKTAMSILKGKEFDYLVRLDGADAFVMTQIHETQLGVSRSSVVPPSTSRVPVVLQLRPISRRMSVDQYSYARSQFSSYDTSANGYWTIDNFRNFIDDHAEFVPHRVRLPIFCHRFEPVDVTEFFSVFSSSQSTPLPTSTNIQYLYDGSFAVLHTMSDGTTSQACGDFLLLDGLLLLLAFVLLGSRPRNVVTLPHEVINFIFSLFDAPKIQSASVKKFQDHEQELEVMGCNVTFAEREEHRAAERPGETERVKECHFAAPPKHPDRRHMPKVSTPPPITRSPAKAHAKQLGNQLKMEYLGHIVNRQITYQS